MPRERNKRGKRADKKRKHHDEEYENEHEDRGQSPKRSRVERLGQEGRPQLNGHDDLEDGGRDLDLSPSSGRQDHHDQANVDGDEDGSRAGGGGGGGLTERPFYGMLDEEEQEFFKQADSTLELDAFRNQEERAAFLHNVFLEADGKELKLACSQSCSRVLEHLIQVSTPAQLKTLFQKFNGKFASHCCEKLFLRAAPLVTEELTQRTQPAIGTDEVFVTFEHLFLHSVSELQGNFGFLITDRSGSHALRLLFLILAGEPVSSAKQRSILQSKRKENSTLNGLDQSVLSKRRSVPSSFSAALERLMKHCVSGLHTQGLRQLAIHPIGSPTLQILLRIELAYFGKQRAKDPDSIYRTLIPEEQATQETESAQFLNGLNYDPVGSHLLETIIEFSPGKTFKNLYKEFWKTRMVSLSRSEVASYVVCSILERIGKEDLIEAHEAIVPTIPDLVDKGRIQVVKTLIERCKVRSVDTQAIAVAVDAHFKGDDDGFDILKLLRLDEKELDQRFGSRIKPEASRAEKEVYNDRAMAEARQMATGAGATANSRSDSLTKVQGAVLAQAMLQIPGALSGLIFDGMARLPPHILIAMAIDPVVSRTLQATMTSTNASIISRRKLVQQFYGYVGEMALDPSASHVVDAIWEGTHGLAYIRERIAEELAENEASLRESPCGRSVWRNWKMDLYKRRRHEWVLQSRNKASNDGFQSFEELEKNKLGGIAAGGAAAAATTTGAGHEDEKMDQRGVVMGKTAAPTMEKTALQKARDRHMELKLRSSEERARGRRSGGGGGGGGGGHSSAKTRGGLAGSRATAA